MGMEELHTHTHNTPHMHARTYIHTPHTTHTTHTHTPHTPHTHTHTHTHTHALTHTVPIMQYTPRLQQIVCK